MVLRGELYHKQVVDYLEKEVRAGSKFFTNDPVLDEAWTRLITQNFRKFREHRFVLKESMLSDLEKVSKIVVLIVILLKVL